MIGIASDMADSAFLSLTWVVYDEEKSTNKYNKNDGGVTMNKLERVQNTLAGRPVDRVPVCFWRQKAAKSLP